MKKFKLKQWYPSLAIRISVVANLKKKNYDNKRRIRKSTEHY